MPHRLGTNVFLFFLGYVIPKLVKIWPLSAINFKALVRPNYTSISSLFPRQYSKSLQLKFSH